MSRPRCWHGPRYLLLGLTLGLVACLDLDVGEAPNTPGTGGASFATGGAATSGGSSTQPLDGTGGGVAPIQCPAGATVCAGLCVDLASDSLHCGACGSVCPAGMSCVAGACTCPTGATVCGGACVDTTSDPAHCGGCDVTCGAGSVCSLGICATTCAPGLTLCDRACVDLSTSRDHCGACGEACAPGLACTAGLCSCPAGTLLCDGRCTDTSSAAAHCGACGQACAAGELCVSGSCIGGSPRVGFVIPAPNSVVSEWTTVEAIVTAEDDDGIDVVRFFLDGVEVRQDDSAPYSWTSQPLAAGTYTLRAEATDNRGMTGEASLTLVVEAGGGTGGTGGSTGGTGGTGGSTGGTGGSTGGTGGSTGGSGGSTGGSGGSTGGECRVTLPGATGSEPGGLIPVCCSPTSTEKAYIDDVFARLNAHRQSNGLSALAYDAALEEAIHGHCVHMSQHSFFDHTAPEAAVSSPWTRAELCDTTANGENIAMGQRDPAAVMTAWINSSGHNANMLSSGARRVGIGYHDQGRYWGQLFGR